MKQNELPIGIFDSGLGGLTALAELARIMPEEDIVYFGDNARIPYGTKSPGIIKKFALQDTRFLLSLGVKAILVACGTVSSNCLAEVERESGLPVVGVIGAAAKKACDIAGKNGTVAVLGTAATVKSGAYERALSALGCTNVVSRACPMFVPLAESWHPTESDIAANAVAEEYLSGVAEKSPAAVILGCTHYPLLSGVIQKQLPGSVLISSGRESARELRGLLVSRGMENPHGGKIRFYTSDDPDLFRENAARFLGEAIKGDVVKADIETF
ncbi:MAG: glutamate racemase [Clostridia bacterium]|nr:glutamate racemase [Clostridia bacterium]